jgi:hypothetical protein
MTTAFNLTRSGMRFRLRRLFLLTAAVALAVSILFRWWPIDGVFGNLLAFVSPEDTVYAPGYTNEGFRAARVRMRRKEIHALLGPPLYTWDNGGGITVEWWTRSPSDGDFRERAFVFNKDMSIEKISGYWLD